MVAESQCCAPNGGEGETEILDILWENTFTVDSLVEQHREVFYDTV
jgi:hypothetical protein